MSREFDALKELGEAVPLNPTPLSVPQFRQKAYLVGPSHAFVRDTNSRGRWILVPRAVVEVPCSQCNAAVFEPCRHTKHQRTWTSTHTGRRVAARMKKWYEARR